MTDTIMFYGMLLNGVHHWTACQGRDKLLRTPRACVIHNPSYHHMNSWYIVWRDDRGIFERQCRHGIGHPDPDQFDYWSETDRMYEAVHGCDGCCSPPKVAMPGIQIGQGNTQINHF